MMEEIPTWGISLPVQSVQEIVRTDPNNIPQRYQRKDECSAADNDVLSHLSSQIPVIDLSLLSRGDETELNKLDMACRDWGFFQIVNHGIASEVLRNIRDAADKFFQLPLQEKKKYAMASDDIQGYGQAYVVSEDQKLDWADLLIMLIYPANEVRKLCYWPAKPPEFIDATEMYSMEANRVAREVLAGLSLLMGLDKDELLELHDDVMQAMRVNYYPTCCKPEQVVGVSPHSDTSSVTVLLQDEGTTGLQIRHSGGWVPVEPIPNALVLNVGDVIEVFSNGKYKSIEHRAMTNESRARISIASFVCPGEQVEIEPLKSCEGDEMKYKKIIYGEYLRSTLNREMDGKSHTQLIKLDRVKSG